MRRMFTARIRLKLLMRYFPLCLLLAFVTALIAGGCSKLHRVDTTPLDSLGMSYDAIQSLRAMDITDAEVSEIGKAKNAGLSDGGAVELVRIARGQGMPFASGEAVAGLLQSGLSEPSVLELARLGQLGLLAGELEALRLTGVSDAVVLAVARRRSEGKPAPSGVSLAKMRDAGISDAGLAELVKFGVTDRDASTILQLRRRRWSQAQILAHFRAARR